MISSNFNLIITQITKIINLPFNKLLILATTAQIASMFLKLIINTIRYKTVSLKEMANYGGMPSSHTVFVMSLLFGIALDKDLGWKSELFAITLVFSMITIVDTIRLRSVIDKIKKGLKEVVEQNNLKTNNIIFPKDIAHTTLDVTIGTIFAFFYTLLFYLFFNNIF